MKHLKRFNEDKEKVEKEELTPSERLKKYQKLREKRMKEQEEGKKKTRINPVVVWP